MMWVIDENWINKAVDTYLLTHGEISDVPMHAFFDSAFADVEARRRHQMTTLAKMAARRRHFTAELVEIMANRDDLAGVPEAYFEHVAATLAAMDRIAAPKAD